MKPIVTLVPGIILFAIGFVQVIWPNAIWGISKRSMEVRGIAGAQRTPAFDMWTRIVGVVLVLMGSILFIITISQGKAQATTANSEVIRSNIILTQSGYSQMRIFNNFSQRIDYAVGNCRAPIMIDDLAGVSEIDQSYFSLYNIVESFGYAGIIEAKETISVPIVFKKFVVDSQQNAIEIKNNDLARISCKITQVHHPDFIYEYEADELGVSGFDYNIL